MHYLGWPDHGLPTIDDLTFDTLLILLITMLLNSHDDEKAVVHCSAGIGRTGTTIALAELLINISSQYNQGIEEPNISIFSTVRRLREQRFLMV